MRVVAARILCLPFGDERSTEPSAEQFHNNLTRSITAVDHATENKYFISDRGSAIPCWLPHGDVRGDKGRAFIVKVVLAHVAASGAGMAATNATVPEESPPPHSSIGQARCPSWKRCSRSLPCTQQPSSLPSRSPPLTNTTTRGNEAVPGPHYAAECDAVVIAVAASAAASLEATYRARSSTATLSTTLCSWLATSPMLMPSPPRLCAPRRATVFAAVVAGGAASLKATDGVRSTSASCGGPRLPQRRPRAPRGCRRGRRRLSCSRRRVALLVGVETFRVLLVVGDVAGGGVIVAGVVLAAEGDAHVAAVVASAAATYKVPDVLHTSSALTPSACCSL